MTFRLDVLLLERLRFQLLEFLLQAHLTFNKETRDHMALSCTAAAALSAPEGFRVCGLVAVALYR